MNTFPSTVDAIIVGAGSAGCSTGRILARSGWNILLIDKKNRPESLGHDWWDSLRIETFHKIKLAEPEPPERLQRKSSTFLSPDGKTKIVRSPAGKYTVDRRIFAQRLLNECHGIDVFFGTTVLEPLINENGAVNGLKLRKDDEEIFVETSLVIDASGFGGIIRKSSILNFSEFFPSHFADRDTLVTYREIRNTSGSLLDSVAYIWFGKHGGVSWINFHQPELVDLFAGVVKLPNSKSPKQIVNDMVKEFPQVGDSLVRGGYGSLIPIRRCVDSFVAPGLVLVGDAAAQCNPIDGSGLSANLWAGYLAGKIITQKGIAKPDPSSYWHYNYEYKTTIGAEFVTLDVLRRFLIARVDPEDTLNYLLSKGVLGTWDDIANTKSTYETKIRIFLKTMDRYGLMQDVRKVSKIAIQAKNLYLHYPKEYTLTRFRKWKEDIENLYSKIPEER